MSVPFFHADLYALLITKQGAVFTVNDVPYVQPPLPVLLQILSGTKNPEDLLPEDSFYVLEANKSVEVSIPAGRHVVTPHGDVNNTYLPGCRNCGRRTSPIPSSRGKTLDCSPHYMMELM